MKKIFTEENFKVGAVVMALIVFLGLILTLIIFSIIEAYKAKGMIVVYSIIGTILFFFLAFVVGHVFNEYERKHPGKFALEKKEDET